MVSCKQARGVFPIDHLPSEHMHIPECYNCGTEMRGSTTDRSRRDQLDILGLISKTTTCSKPVRFVTRYPGHASVSEW